MNKKILIPPPLSVPRGQAGVNLYPQACDTPNS